jgi:hypothetical protein
MKTISHSERLGQKVERLLPMLGESIAEVMNHPHFRELYPELVILTHQGMRATAAILRAAAARCRELEGEDPLATPLAPYYAQQAREEDHDHWALEDLEVLGVPRETALRRMPSATLASMVGAQYYWVLHHHPVALLGHHDVREGYAPDVAIVEELMARTGYPREAFRNTERHCLIDRRHRAEVIELLDGLPLTDEHHAMMGVSALHTIEMGIQANHELLERAAGAKRRVRA